MAGSHRVYLTFGDDWKIRSDPMCNLAIDAVMVSYSVENLKPTVSTPR